MINEPDRAGPLDGMGIPEIAQARQAAAQLVRARQLLDQAHDELRARARAAYLANAREADAGGPPLNVSALARDIGLEGATLRNHIADLARARRTCSLR